MPLPGVPHDPLWQARPQRPRVSSQTTLSRSLGAMSRPHIAVLGLFAADLTSRVPRLPHWHETLVGFGATLGPGGKASNQAIAAARLGAAASFIGKVGADPFGDMARRLYDQEGIDRSYLATSSSEATGTALIL